MRINRSSAVGSVLLFKTELDSNNIPAAADILANPNGSKFLAVERVEYYDELYRIKNIINKRPVTWIKDDTLSPIERKLEIEFGYLKKFRFTTSKIDSNWYILNWEMI